MLLEGAAGNPFLAIELLTGAGLCRGDATVLASARKTVTDPLW
ncbi:hypothetical protein ACPPVO_44175 [Dactylosporangium sp. McL0621]